MKIQIQEQRLRFRLDEDELARLLETGRVGSDSRLAPEVGLRQEIELVDAAIAPELTFLPGLWRLRLARADLLAYRARLPCREGLDYALPSGEPERPLRLSVEVDVRDSVRLRGPKRRGDALSGQDT